MTTKIEAHSLRRFLDQVKGLPDWDPGAPNKDCPKIFRSKGYIHENEKLQAHGWYQSIII